MRTPAKTPSRREREEMEINIELQGLEEVKALLEENRRLTDELMDNISKLHHTCMSINGGKKEKQPQAANYV